MSFKDNLTYANTTFLDDNICVIENFLPEEVWQELYSACVNATEEDWAKYQIGEKWVNKVLDYPISSAVELVVKGIIEQAAGEEYVYDGLDLLRRVPPGHSIAEHWDAQNWVQVAAGVIIYLNDDFEGGEIYYPNKGLSYKPCRNSLVLHPATEPYKHGVNEVTSGMRYYITMFANYKGTLRE